MIFSSKVTPTFRTILQAIANDLGVDPNWLMACMEFESGLNPKAKNPHSSATGLIQFMETTAKALGTSTKALARMSAVTQLQYVHLYFLPYKGRLKSLSDCYMAILWPKAIGKPGSFILFQGNKAYAVNKGLDKNKDGAVTKDEAAAKVYAVYARGLEQEQSQ